MVVSLGESALSPALAENTTSTLSVFLILSGSSSLRATQTLSPLTASPLNVRVLPILYVIGVTWMVTSLVSVAVLSPFLTVTVTEIVTSPSF